METLRARALELAAPRVTASTAPQVGIIAFAWRGQSWAVDSDFIDEVIPLTSMTPLPNLAGTYMGLIHYRGEIYPVVDISSVFDLSDGPRQKPTHALLVKCAKGVIAIAAMGLEGASTIDEAAISPMTAENAKHPALRGLTPNLAVLFDPVQLLDDSRMIVNEQPVTTTSAGGPQQ